MSRSADQRTKSSVLVTMGEPAGIGPEVAVSAFRRLEGHIRQRSIKLVVAPEILRGCNRDLPTKALIATKNRARRTPGKPDKQNSAAVCEAISLAVQMASAGRADAIVTGPINKAVLAESEFRFS